MIIAIDGPAASGKSTVAKAIAARLGFEYLDTGAMYRAVAYRALATNTDVDDEARVSKIAGAEQISFAHDPATGLATQVFIGGEDVTTAIRTPPVDHAVSPVAKHARVRSALVDQQRAIGNERDIVVEGRDIGTVVFPHAEVKVFLTASAEERARRREIDHAVAGHDVEGTSVLEALERRDKIDSSREASPLAKADDAHELDTTGLTIDQVVDRIARWARDAGHTT